MFGNKEKKKKRLSSANLDKNFLFLIISTETEEKYQMYISEKRGEDDKLIALYVFIFCIYTSIRLKQ